MQNKIFANINDLQEIFLSQFFMIKTIIYLNLKMNI